MEPLSREAPESVVIPSRFNGPPGTSNGGYACGVVASLLGTRSARVALRQPPPLDRPLTVLRASGGEGPGEAGVRLVDGDATVAEGSATQGPGVAPPEGVSFGSAEEGSRSFPWYEGHPFPTCFVCGPLRAPDDGLRIFAGAVPGVGVYASPWTPAGEWGDARGAVRSEIVWAALDCPSAVAAAAQTGEGAPPAVLAALEASVEREVRAGEPHVVVAWPLGWEGRKRSAGSAIVDAVGEVRARARALWIEVRA